MAARDQIIKATPSTKDFIARFLNLVVRLIKWRQDSHLDEFWQVLHYARMSVFVLLFGAAFLILDQGRELAMRLDQDWRHIVFYYVSLFFWALQSWFGSRRMLSEQTIEQMLCQSTENRKALHSVIEALASPSAPQKSANTICASAS